VRIIQLIDSISQVSFHFTRRGLFEKHKLIVSSMLTFRILQRNGELSPKEIEHLILGKADPFPPSLPEPLKGFLNEAIWANVKGLEQLPVFSSLGSSLESEYLVWKKWYQEERVEDVGELPKSYKEISKFHKLLLYRAMRPDRVASALTSFVGEMMGERYVEQPPFSIFETFA
jgi:dynein heavy chain